MKRIDLLKSIKGDGVVPIGAWIKVTESDAQAGQLLEWCSEAGVMQTGLAHSNLLEAAAHYFYGIDDRDLLSDQVLQLIHYVDTVVLPGGSREDKIFMLQNANWWLTLWAAEDEGNKFRKKLAEDAS